MACHGVISAGSRRNFACCIKLEITPPSISNHSRYGTPVGVLLKAIGASASYRSVLADGRVVAVFAEGGFVASWAAATKAGWLETQRNGVREFICPGCQP